ncbi:hypothetical protein Agabi119p4_9181 [Agaricus bisporus var. burnettii]|uniref:Uncharacterized protein n=1 Tax=Agaricus bisporus var. burnettii TaxID=192524 RepID=A0A8H7C5U7_AGABI|nr:hypothetical protein Agabi119p4_9181 [Agaricus bisporus var. burnettii]
MPRKTNKSSTPAPTPHPYHPPSQVPPPPANPTAARLTVSDVETLLKPEYSSTGLMTLAFWSLDSQENRAIMDAVRNRGIAPAVAIANAEASALAKGNVKGPSGHSTGIGAAPPAVKTPPRVPTPPPRVSTPPPPVPTFPPSPPRAPSPSASVLSSKRPISPGSSSSGPSVAAVSYISILLVRRVSRHVPAAFYYSPVTEAPNYSILRKRIQRDEVKRYQERKETETETKQIKTLIQT